MAATSKPSAPSLRERAAQEAVPLFAAAMPDGTPMYGDLSWSPRARVPVLCYEERQAQEIVAPLSTGLTQYRVVPMVAVPRDTWDALRSALAPQQHAEAEIAIDSARFRAACVEAGNRLAQGEDPHVVADMLAAVTATRPNAAQRAWAQMKRVYDAAMRVPAEDLPPKVLDACLAVAAEAASDISGVTLTFDRALPLSSAGAEAVREAWQGSPANWIAPVHACPGCHRSLDWHERSSRVGGWIECKCLCGAALSFNLDAPKVEEIDAALAEGLRVAKANQPRPGQPTDLHMGALPLPPGGGEALTKEQRAFYEAARADYPHSSGRVVTSPEVRLKERQDLARTYDAMLAAEKLLAPEPRGESPRG